MIGHQRTWMSDGAERPGLSVAGEHWNNPGIAEQERGQRAACCLVDQLRRSRASAGVTAAVRQLPAWKGAWDLARRP